MTKPRLLYPQDLPPPSALITVMSKTPVEGSGMDMADVRNKVKRFVLNREESPAPACAGVTECVDDAVRLGRRVKPADGERRGDFAGIKEEWVVIKLGDSAFIFECTFAAVSNPLDNQWKLHSRKLTWALMDWSIFALLSLADAEFRSRPDEEDVTCKQTGNSWTVRLSG